MDTSVALHNAIRAHLKSGQWRAGQRIPTERELSTQFGISRTTVRRVLAQFKTQKLITQVVGSGTYVCESAASLLSQGDAGLDIVTTSPAELMAARLVLEPALVEMVIGNATPADFARMEDCCERAEAATTLEDFEHWDGMLHEVIAEAAHNSFMLNVFRLINRARAQGEWGLLKKRSVTAERRTAYQHEHRDIVNALRQRDLATAREVTLGHLLHVRRNLLGR